jgi:GDSL-like Lipase/Acylhydrolase family
MPIKPVSGKIKSQEINDNLSYLESTFKNINKGSPKGTYATLSALQTAYPSGDDGVYVITADGKWYFWDGTAWTEGGVYQSTGFADGSVSPEKTSFMGVENITLTENTGYYIHENGNLITGSAFSYSNSIVLEQNETIVFEATGYLQSVAMISEWSESGSFLKTHALSIDGTHRTYSYTATKEKEFIRLSWRTSFGYSVFKYPEVVEKTNNIEKKLKTLNDLGLTLTTGKYINASLVYVSHANPLYVYSDPVILFKGETINLLNAKNSATVSIFTRCDNNGELLESLVLAETNDLKNFSYTATDDIEYIRVSYYASGAYVELDRNISSMANTFNKFIEPPATTYQFTNKRDLRHLIKSSLCIGDSITRGGYYHNGYTGQPIDENYPYYLSQMTDWTVTNAGHSGITTLGWYQDQSNNYDLVNQNAYVICLGTNGGLTDTLETDVDPYSVYTDYAATNTGAYCAIIEKIYENNPDALIYMVDINHSSGDLEVSKAVLAKIATKYDLPLVDKSVLKDATVLHPSNTVHFGKVGNLRLAELVLDGIVDDMYNNLSKYEILM